MSLIADAVKKAGEDKERNQFSPGPSRPKSSFSFWAASAVFVVMVAALAALYFYEESRIDELDRQLAEARGPLNFLKSQNEALLREKGELERQAGEATQKNKQKIDDLLGKDRVLEYENQTLEADNAQKEKKIAELQAEIEKQAEREEGLMTLIEQAKKQLAAKPAAPPVAAVTAQPQTESAPAVSPAPAAPAVPAEAPQA